jgi:quercetin dioxygenase-like cupin family protein
MRAWPLRGGNIFIRPVSRFSMTTKPNELNSPTLDIMGPRIIFAIPPEVANESFCVIHSILPPGAVVALHSHEDVEGFYIVSGELEVVREEAGEYRWTTLEAEEFIHISSWVKHGLRNRSAGDVRIILTTTAKMGRFFQEVGEEVDKTASESPMQHLPERLQRFAEASTRYGYWLAGPRINAELGLLHG